MNKYRIVEIVAILIVVVIGCSAVFYFYTRTNSSSPTSTAVKNPTSVDATLLSLFPPSPLPETAGSNPTLNSTYSPSGSTWAKVMNEKDVFQELLSDAGTDSSNVWQARIGKGGQLYSLRTPAGEVVVPQGNPGSDWMDGVFQTTALDTAKDIQNPPKGTTPSPMYALQAGIYQDDPSFSGLFYSPLLAQNSTSDSYQIVNWTQQAHIPNLFTSHALIYTQYKDVGGGVIEVDTLLYNFANADGDTLDRIHTPWDAIRDTTYPQFYLSNTQGIPEPGNKETTTNTLLPLIQTGGWGVFTTADPSSNPSSLAIVFGTNAPNSQLRYAISGGPALHAFVATPIVQTPILPGKTFFYRYFLVIGSYKNVIAQSASLAKYAGVSALSFSAAQSPVLSWDTSSTAGAVPHTGNSSPRFCTYAYPVTDTLPVFVLKNSVTGTTTLSTNPYQYSPTSVSNNHTVYYPYEGKVTYQGILGFVPRNGALLGTCSTQI